mgnify:CR=1 FL=1
MINAYYFYKFSNQMYRLKIPILPRIIQFFCFLIFNSATPYQCSIGKRTRFAYGGIGVVIHKRAVIGSNTVIGSNVTIGGRSKYFEVPKIGNNVYIATGAKILGPIVIGNDVIIGANAVIIDNVPDKSTVVGVPGRII